MLCPAGDLTSLAVALYGHPPHSHEDASMNARTMVSVEPEPLRAVRAEAKAQGISSAERMRRLVQ
jgi:hypothetical protein